MSLECPKCKAEAVRFRIQYEDIHGHTWGEEVDRSVTGSQYTNSKPGSGKKMPFGKHKGVLLEDLPVDYMRWCLENIESLSPDLKEEFENQLQLKAGKGVVRKEVKVEGKKVTFK